MGSTRSRGMDADASCFCNSRGMKSVYATGFDDRLSSYFSSASSKTRSRIFSAFSNTFPSILLPSDVTIKDSAFEKEQHVSSNTHANDDSPTIIRIRVRRTGIVVLRQQHSQLLADIIDRIILITVNILRALETRTETTDRRPQFTLPNQSKCLALNGDWRLVV